jgi:uncharacterized protein YbaR (Trm112 family)
MASLFDLLVDPVDRQPLVRDGEMLIAANGTRYPIIDGIPILLRADVPHTHRTAVRSLRLAAWPNPETIDPVMALNIPEISKDAIRADIARGIPLTTAAICHLIPLTNGLAFRGADSRLAKVPVPVFPERGTGQSLLDLGCSWGRWTLAATSAGFAPIGIDSALGPLMVARRLAAEQGLNIPFVCADVRFMPFKDGAFDRVFSYSTLQHFSDDDCDATLAETAPRASTARTFPHSDGEPRWPALALASDKTRPAACAAIRSQISVPDGHRTNLRRTSRAYNNRN